MASSRRDSNRPDKVEASSNEIRPSKHPIRHWGGIRINLFNNPLERVMKAPVPPVYTKQIKDTDQFIPNVDKMMGACAYARYSQIEEAAECYAKNLELAWELGWNAREKKFKTDMNLSD